MLKNATRGFPPWYCGLIGVFFVGDKKKIMTIYVRIVIFLLLCETGSFGPMGLY